MKRGIVVSVMLFIVININAQKSVLLEKFTNVYCGNCPDASLTIMDLQDEYDNVIWINHYKPTCFEEHLLKNDDSKSLWNDLQVTGYPLAMIDRTPYNNELVQGKNRWEDMVLERKDLTTPVEIEINVTDFDVVTRQLTFDVDAVYESMPVSNKELRLSVFILEDDVWWKQHSYYNNTAGHPLEGLGDIIWAYKHINVVRKIMDNPWGSDDVFPQNVNLNQSYSKEYKYILPEDYRVEKIEIVAAVGYHNPSDFEDSEILNARNVNVSDFNLILSDTDEPLSQTTKVYPNPSNQFFYLEFQTLPDWIILKDIFGKDIKKIKPTSLQMNIDVQNLPSGEYIIQILKDKNFASQKMVILN